MSRTLTACGAFALGALVSPQAAYAIGSEISGVPTLNLVISLSGLVVAMILLIEVVMLRKIALGGAITERISYVVLAIVCLGASALAQWTRNFVDGVTLEQVTIASEVLVIVAMALLAAYFWNVRRAFEGYLNAMTGGEMLAAEDGSTDDDVESPRG